MRDTLYLVKKLNPLRPETLEKLFFEKKNVLKIKMNLFSSLFFEVVS